MKIIGNEEKKNVSHKNTLTIYPFPKFPHIFVRRKRTFYTAMKK